MTTDQTQTPADSPLTRETLEQALATQERLVEEVRGLHRLEQVLQRIRVIQFICVVLALIAVGAGIAAVTAIRRTDNAREEARIEQCQVRNNSARETRQAIDLSQKVSTDRLNLFIRDIKAAFPVSPQLAIFLDAELALPSVDVTPAAEDVDSDCNLDGVIDELDYPAADTLRT